MRNRFTQDPKSTFTPAALAALAAAGMVASPLGFAGTITSASTAQNTKGNTFKLVHSSANNALLKGDVLRGAAGRIGTNVASGNANAQSNATTVVKSSNKNNVLASSKQSHGNMTITSELSGAVSESNESHSNTDTMWGHVLQGASGNISVNSAAGSANQQANSTALATGNHGTTNIGAGAQQSSYNSSFNNSADYATDAGQSAKDHVSEKATIKGNVLRGASGNISVNAAAGAGNAQANATAVSRGKGMIDEGASVSQGQYGNKAMSNGPNTASLQGNALQGVNGNIGVNIASGVNNQQANATSLAANNGRTSKALSKIGQKLNNQSVQTYKAHNTTSLSGSVFRGASGNIQANAASGQSNAQANSMAISLKNKALQKQASSYVTHQKVKDTSNHVYGGANRASLSGHAFQGASGNISVNVASGANNAQANSLTVVSGTSGTSGTSTPSTSSTPSTPTD